MLRMLLLLCCLMPLHGAEETIALSQGASFQAIGSYYIRIVPNKSSASVYYLRRDKIILIRDDGSKPDAGSLIIETQGDKTFIIPKKYIPLADVLKVIDRP